MTEGPAPPYLDWPEDLTVGDPEIDDQHHRLIDLVNRFYSALARQDQPPKEALGALLLGLMQYTRYHFATEQRLMDESAFPGAAAHAAEHEQFVQRVNGLADRFSKGQPVVSLEATVFVRDWLVNHIMRADKVLARHLAETRNGTPRTSS